MKPLSGCYVIYEENSLNIGPTRAWVGFGFDIMSRSQLLLQQLRERRCFNKELNEFVNFETVNFRLEINFFPNETLERAARSLIRMKKKLQDQKYTVSAVQEQFDHNAWASDQSRYIAQTVREANLTRRGDKGFRAKADALFQEMGDTITIKDLKRLGMSQTSAVYHFHRLIPTGVK